MTPNTQITKENVGPGGYLVKDFADGWYWTPNATVECLTGALVWSVANSRYETEPDRPALSPPAEGEGRGDDYEGPDAGMHDTEIDDRDDEDTTPAPAPVDWTVVGPKLVEALGTIRAKAKSSTSYFVRSRAAERFASIEDIAAAALAAAQPEGPDTIDERTGHPSSYTQNRSSSHE